MCHKLGVHVRCVFSLSRRRGIDACSIPAFTQWVKDPGVAMNCGVGHRRGLDLWQLAAAAPIRLLAWELLHAMGVALKK